MIALYLGVSGEEAAQLAVNIAAQVHYITYMAARKSTLKAKNYSVYRPMMKKTSKVVLYFTIYILVCLSVCIQ